jgi:hypothetical protein
MKKILFLVVAAGMTFAFSGCSAKKETLKLEGLNGNGCNNPQCQCPKPCQCGPSCRCGINGN